MKKKVYFVWDGDEKFWRQYDSIEEACADSEEPVEVFEADMRSLGKFENVARLVKGKKVKP